MHNQLTNMYLNHLLTPQAHWLTLGSGIPFASTPRLHHALQKRKGEALL